MSLDSLPIEVICLIVSYLPWRKNMLPLLLCNRMLHDIVIHLLYKVDEDERVLTGNRPLRWLIKRGFESGVQRMISRNNLDVNMPLCSRYLTSANTPLLHAIKYCHTNIAELLLRNGAQVNLDTDTSALQYSVTLGDYNMTRLLLQHGAHVDLVSSGICPLGRALEYNAPSHDQNPWSSETWDNPPPEGDKELVNVILLLLAHGADPHFQYGKRLPTCLHRMTRRPWISMKKLFRLFLDYGADLNARDSRGNTPLHVSFVQNAFLGNKKAQKEFVGLLLRSGADVNIQNHRREPPLGTRFGDPDIFEQALKQGASTRCRGEKGAMALHTILKTRLRKQKNKKQHQINTVLIELLLEHGARADQVVDGKCLLDLPAARMYPVLENLVKVRMAAREVSRKPSSESSSVSPSESFFKESSKESSTKEVISGGK
ncbi:hypothetical protein N7519_003504 [Penicillium mononematosum]|uniref:uncharacterized protein n=1 Tax=Penicillium mononematosum TaxID=268346 RepID=UPI002547DB05|nr:uncharacterized protein N7519_003504 [Penicillium mononematosum]KAJ6188596.1 hypothetical protein N7519_003504 [Penicillium mononematosum]